MKKVVMYIVLLGIIFLYGCGSKDSNTTVKVEIETIPIVTPASETELETEAVLGTDEQASEAEVISETETKPESETEPESGTESETETKPESETEPETETIPADSPRGVNVAYYGATAKGILEKAGPELKYLGYDLVPIECNDYEKANEMVLFGEADACLCENQAYLDSYNMINSTNLSIVERIYAEPYAIFPGKTKELNHLGNSLVIAVMNGEISTARTLHLLEQKGIVELKEQSGYQACMENVVRNPHGVKLEPVDFNSGFPGSEKYDLIVCDYNHALVEGIDPDDALGYENRNSQLMDLFAVCLVSTGDKADSEKISKLSKALNSESVESFIEESFYHSVIDYR